MRDASARFHCTRSSTSVRAFRSASRAIRRAISFKLSDIARPRVLHEAGHRLGRKLLVATVLLVEPGQEPRRQEGNLLLPLPKRCFLSVVGACGSRPGSRRLDALPPPGQGQRQPALMGGGAGGGSIGPPNRRPAPPR